MSSCIVHLSPSPARAAHVPLVRQPLQFQYVEVGPVVAPLQRLPYLPRRVVHYRRRLTLHRGRHRGGGARGGFNVVAKSSIHAVRTFLITDLILNSAIQHLEIYWHIKRGVLTSSRLGMPCDEETKYIALLYGPWGIQKCIWEP